MEGPNVNYLFLGVGGMKEEMKTMTEKEKEMN